MGLDIVTVYYDSEFNVFEDENGDIIYDMFSIIRPARLERLKNMGGGTEYVYNKKRCIVYELIFEIYEEEDYE